MAAFFRMLSTLKKLMLYPKMAVVEFKRGQLLNRLWTKYNPYTMIGRDSYIANLELSLRAGSIAGSIVECGTWRGGMIAGIADLMGVSREYYLYDSFEGLPIAKDIDGEEAMKWQSETTSDRYFNNCTASIDEAKKVIALSKATKVHFRKGWFHETLAASPPVGSIAILRLDGDWYESTMSCLTYLFPRVAEKGIIIIDDYYTWDGCSKAVHDYLSSNGRSERIMQYKNICYLVKRND
jgi:O-methyltransferase